MSARRLLVAASALVGLLIVVFAFVLLKRAWTPPPMPVLANDEPAALASASVAPPVATAPLEERTPEVRGHVLGVDGNPVEGAAVRLVSASPPYEVYRTATTDAVGAFAFPRLGAWRVRAVADHGTDGVVTSAIVRVVAGQTVDLTLVLSAASAVSGTVVDDKGHAVAGAQVSVEGVPWTVTATSDDQGAFRLTTVPDEAKSLVAVARGFRAGRAALGHRDDQAELTVRIVLTGASAVGGDVKDEQGNPAPGMSVVACEDQPTEARVQSAPDGTFELPPSAIGCDAVAEDQELAPSDAARVVEGQRVSLQMKPGGAIQGGVQDEHGTAVSAFSVGIESYVPTRGKVTVHTNHKAYEDMGGNFRWDRLGPGTYVLIASVSGRPPAKSEPIDVRAGAVTSGVRIVVPQGGSVVGRVFDGAHGPLAGAKLRFDYVSSVFDSKSSATSDAAGAYRLDGAPAGPFTVRVERDGFRSKLVSALRVASGQTMRVDVVLNAGSGWELGGIGAGLNQKPGGVELGNVYAGDPGALAGLKQGDRIVRVDGESIDGLSIADVLQRIRGEPGTSVGLSVVHPDTGQSVDLTIVRGDVSH